MWLILLFFGVSAQAQIRINGVGIGFDVNSGGNMRSPALIELMSGSNSLLFEPNTGIGLDRFLTSYTLTLANPDKDFFGLELDLMQGTDYIYNSIYSYDDRNDTSFYNSVYFDISGATIGARVMAKLRTPSSKRFHYHFGIGGEFIYTYNVTTDAYNSISISHWPSNYYYYENNKISTNVITNYQSYNLIQQVGIAFRLGKDEKNFPLNRTYLETDFQIMTNFTAIAEELSTYRSYGGSFSLIYEFR